MSAWRQTLPPSALIPNYVGLEAETPNYVGLEAETPNYVGLEAVTAT